MPRNHCRVNQTSTDLIQTWRGNCDIQILIYDSDPDNFDLKEISKVTDYVVAYSCKGNTTHREEIDTNKKLILAMDESTYDEGELRRVCKQVMNKAASSRLISKAEASVLLANLSLTTCSDYIEAVSITDSINMCAGEGQTRTKSFLDQYRLRPSHQYDLSLHQFYKVFRQTKQGKKPAIPHYIGVSGEPVFPVTEAYAQHVLVVYKPWNTQYPKQSSWKSDFERFINSKACPLSPRLAYDRVVQRYNDGLRFVDPKCSSVDHSVNPVGEEDTTLLRLIGLPGNDDGTGSMELTGLDRGMHFNWSHPPLVRYSFLAIFRAARTNRCDLLTIISLPLFGRPCYTLTI